MRKETKEFLDKYGRFVNSVTSIESRNTEAFIERLRVLRDQGCDAARLDTAAIGMPAEASEFSEIVKKILFQGKPYDDERIAHMKKELGDVMWYWMQGCIALNLDPVEVIEENIKKLESRYPGGKFDIYKSENRSANDV